MKALRDSTKLRVEFLANTKPLSDDAAQAKYEEIQRALRKVLLDAGIDIAAVASESQHDTDYKADSHILPGMVL